MQTFLLKDISPCRHVKIRRSRISLCANNVTRGSYGAWSLFFFLLLSFLLPATRVEAGLWDDYNALLDQRAAEAEGYEIWGNTFLPPAGMWGFQYKYNIIKSDSRYDENGKKGPILAPVDILGGELDLNPRGSAVAHKFAFLCGLGKGWAFAIECQMGTYDLEFDVDYRPPTTDEAKIAAFAINDLLPFFGLIPPDQVPTEKFTESLEGLWQTIELLGHPRPVLVQEDKGLKMGDLSLAVGCNYYRTKHISLLGAVKFSFPTGHTADPNSALTFALGPDLDVGVGSYGFEFGHLVDFRLPEPLDWIMFATEVYYSFYTKHKRKSPTVFTKPNENIITILDWAGTDVGPYFPDLSRMESEYEYLPGSKVRGVFQILPTLFGILPLSFGIQANYTNGSEITTNTPEFVQYINAIGLLADSWSVEGWAKITLGLFPLKIPATISAGFNQPIAGKNALILEDNWEFTFQFYSPWFFGEQIFPVKKIFSDKKD